MQNGDFIRMDFTGRLQTGELFDTTDEATAKKENAFNPKQKYKPALVIIGSGMVVPGVEASLLHMKPGEEKELDLKPSEGYGSRDPNKIRVIALAKFIKDKVNPTPGTFVNIDGMDARIQSVSGGRVRVDFNHPLAGRMLHYKIRVVERIDSPKEKAEGLFDHYGFKGETTFHEGILHVKTDKTVPDFVQQIFTMSLKKWVPEIKEIKFPSKDGKTHENKKPTDAQQAESAQETASSGSDSDDISRPEE